MRASLTVTCERGLALSEGKTTWLGGQCSRQGISNYNVLQEVPGCSVKPDQHIQCSERQAGRQGQPAPEQAIGPECNWEGPREGEAGGRRARKSSKCEGKKSRI